MSSDGIGKLPVSVKKETPAEDGQRSACFVCPFHFFSSNSNLVLCTVYCSTSGGTRRILRVLRGIEPHVRTFNQLLITAFGADDSMIPGHAKVKSALLDRMAMLTTLAFF